MSNLTCGFDHAIVGVGDLEAARLSWQRLGFTTCPRGKHIGWGTANYCIMFADDYLELLGIVDASQFTNKSKQQGTPGETKGNRITCQQDDTGKHKHDYGEPLHV